MLTRHPWPGNVRELRNCMERAVLAGPRPGDLAGRTALREGAGRRDRRMASRCRWATTVDEAERELIVRTLASTGNNKTRAADILGISLKTLHNKLNRYALTPHGPA